MTDQQYSPEGVILTFVIGIVVVIMLLAMATQRGLMVGLLALLASAMLIWGPALT